MSTRIYVSTLEASYFETQLLGYDNNPPTEGDHTVGDIVLSSVQQNDVLGWVCVKAGNPGEWKDICDIVNVKNSINQNKNDISKLAGRVTKTEADIREINNDILDLNKNIKDNNSDLEDRINENANNISNLRIDVNDNKGNIQNNLNSINDLRTQIEDAKRTLNNVGNQANTNADDIANIERELLEIDNRLDNTDSNNTNLLNTIQNELNTLKNNVGKEGTTSTPATGIHKELNDLQKEFDELKDLVIDGDGDINSVIQNLQKADENINKEINDIKELITGNEADNDEIIEVLQKEIDDNKDDITELQKGVEGNKTEIDDLKQGLIDSLKEKNIDVKDNINWKELFGLLLQGLVKPEDPDEPENPEEPEDPDEPEIPENKECTSIRFTESSLKIHIDQVTDLKEILVIQPDGCTDPVEWVADNTIIEINNGVIKGLAEGSTKVQARCGGLSANINITVVPKIPENDEPLDILIDEITIQVEERYDATKLYTLQEGYNVQYKYTSIIAIEDDHTIVGKEVGTTELEIVCGGIINTVTVNVIEKPRSNTI